MGTTSSKPAPSPSPPPRRRLDIIVVGAGIGGLTAAIALRRQGHRVHVYEASNCDDEAGAAINLCPNAAKCLKRLGIDARKHGAVELERMRLIIANGEVIEDRDMRVKADKWQSDWLLTHRAHLYAHLKATLLADDSDANDHDYASTFHGKLCFGMSVTDVDTQEGLVTFADGSAEQADIIIGADGVHSKTRLAISTSIRPYRSQRSAFRFLVPREEALRDPRTAFFSRKNCMEHWYSAGSKAVVYPCVKNEVLNFVCIHPARLSSTPLRGANRATKVELMKVFEEFDPILLAMFEKAVPDTLDVYPLLDMDPLPTFVKDRLVLIGDAAHPLLPYLAQGAAMAIEDAMALGVMLCAGTRVQEVRERLEMFNEARYERTAALQRHSRIVGEDGMGSGVGRRLSVHDYLEYAFDHDEFEESGKVLERWMAEKEDSEEMSDAQSQEDSEEKVNGYWSVHGFSRLI